MAINVSIFHLSNVVDTCAIWNVLSSPRFFTAALGAGVGFAVTQVVVYECLFKARKQTSVSERRLQDRLSAAMRAAHVIAFGLDVDDLQMIAVLENRKRLGKGELSSIAFAIKTRQAVLTDDQKARKLAQQVLPEPGVQTTPHLLGWLLFNNKLMDHEKDLIVREHVSLGRPLAEHLETAYLEACRCRLMVNTRPT